MWIFLGLCFFYLSSGSFVSIIGVNTCQQTSFHLLLMSSLVLLTNCLFISLLAHFALDIFGCDHENFSRKKIYPCWQCWHRRWFGWKKCHFIEIEWDSLLKLSQKSYCMGKPPNEPLEMCIRKWLPFFGYFISYRFELHSKVLHFQCHSFTFINDVVRTCCCRCFPPELETAKCKSDITYVFVYILCWQSVNKNLNQIYGNSFYLCHFQCKLSTILLSNRIDRIESLMCFVSITISFCIIWYVCRWFYNVQ